MRANRSRVTRNFPGTFGGLYSGRGLFYGTANREFGDSRSVTIRSCACPNVQCFRVRLEVNNMSLKLTKIFQKVPEGYIGFVEELPGANTQGDTLEEARTNLDEAIALVLEANRALAEEQIRGQDDIRESVVLSAA